MVDIINRLRYGRRDPAMSIEEEIAALPEPVMAPADVKDPIGALGDVESGKATYKAHPELAP